MKELAETIKKGGFTYKKVYENSNGYVYEQVGYNQYEAFFRVINTQYNCVSFPGNEAFGKWAWSCGSLDRAIKRITK